jgi:crossover junction endonuclease EME1
VKFVRKVRGEWDEQAGLFRPVEEYRRDEEWVVHWMKAEKFVDLAVFDETGMALQFHLERVQGAVRGAKVLVVLEGLAGLLSKAKNARNRVHDALVRSQLGQTSRGKTDERLVELDVEKVEEALIEMQLVHEIRVIQTSSSADSAEWISILAADIASIPYRSSLPRPFSFLCMGVLTVDGRGCFWRGIFVWMRDR